MYSTYDFGVTTRKKKGSALTHDEMDSNFEISSGKYNGQIIDFKRVFSPDDVINSSNDITIQLLPYSTSDLIGAKNMVVSIDYEIEIGTTTEDSVSLTSHKSKAIAGISSAGVEIFFSDKGVFSDISTSNYIDNDEKTCISALLNRNGDYIHSIKVSAYSSYALPFYGESLLLKYSTAN